MTRREEEDRATNRALYDLYRVDPASGREYAKQIVKEQMYRDIREVLIGTVIGLVIMSLAMTYWIMT